MGLGVPLLWERVSFGSKGHLCGREKEGGGGAKPPLISKCTSHLHPTLAPHSQQAAVSQGAPKHTHLEWPLCLYLAGHDLHTLPSSPYGSLR